MNATVDMTKLDHRIRVSSLDEIVSQIVETWSRQIEYLKGSQLDEKTYRDSDPNSSIGMNIRHSINYIDALLNGYRGDYVDYTSREPSKVNSRIERDLETGLSELDKRVSRIRNEDFLPYHSISPIMIVDDIGSNFSTLGRELSFVSSHYLEHLGSVRKDLFYNGLEIDPRFSYTRSSLEKRN